LDYPFARNRDTVPFLAFGLLSPCPEARPFSAARALQVLRKS
jgi:hypothetical protein